jgi:WD40 repeat protein
MDLHPNGTLQGGYGTALAVSPDGTWLAAARPGALCLWRGDELVHDVAIPGHGAGAVRFSDDGSCVRAGVWTVTVGDGAPSLAPDIDDLMLQGIDFGSRAAPRLYSRRAATTSADGGRTVLTFVYGASRGLGDDAPNAGPRGQAVLIDPVAGRLVAVLEADLGPFPQRELAIDDTWVAVAGLGLGLFDAADGTPAAPEVDLGQMCSSLALSTFGGSLALGQVDGAIQLRSVPALALVAGWDAHTDRVTALAFHPTLPLLATGSDDEQLKLWTLDDQTAEMVAWHWAERPVRGLAFDPGGEQLLVATDEEIAVLDITS